MFCPNCGKNIGDSKYCTYCGSKINGESENLMQNFHNQETTSNKSTEVSSYSQTNPKKKKNSGKKIGCLIFFIIFVIMISIIVAVSTKSGTTPNYIAIDRQQSTEQNLQTVVDFVGKYLSDQGYTVSGYSTEWIGYYKYSDLYDKEEYEDLQMGGYYSYNGTLSTGEIVSSAISCYWGENEEPQIVYLHVETYTEENELIPYTDEAMLNCWKAYLEKASE